MTINVPVSRRGSLIGAAILLIVAASPRLDAQIFPPRGMHPPGMMQAGSIQLETITLPAAESAAVILHIGYRIRTDFFIPVSNPGRYDGSLRIRGDLIVEISGPGNFPAGYFHTAIDTTFTSQSPFVDSLSTICGHAAFRLLPGNYTLTAELSDKSSPRKNRMPRPIRISASSAWMPALWDLILSQRPVTGTSPDLMPWNLGGGVPIGLPSDLWVTGRRTDSAAGTTLIVACATLPHDSADHTRKLLWLDTLRSEDAIRGTIFADSVLPGQFAFHLGPGSAGDLLFRLPLPTDTLPEGRYRITATLVSADGKSTDAERDFTIIWFDKPASLTNTMLALEALEYIAGRDEAKRIRDGSREEQLAKLEAFWKPRDPSPKTAYNEAMAEYYRRVDYALSAYATVSEPDGIRTDRGKTYILLGSPATISRDLPPGEPPREVWIYPKLHRKFIFTDASRLGNYKLTDTQELP